MLQARDVTNKQTFLRNTPSVSHAVAAANGGGATQTGLTTTLSKSSGAVSTSTPIVIAAACQGKTETDERESMFILKNGAILPNVIASQAEVVHGQEICWIRQEKKIGRQRNIGRLGDQVVQDPADDLERQARDGAAEDGPEEQDREPEELGQRGRRELVQQLLRDGDALLPGVERRDAAAAVAAVMVSAVEGRPLDHDLAAGRHRGDTVEG
ncbi:pectate lyase-domain-containing protein [Apiospora hydei]|uniref:Pectate lyase n=1 Tax=Apiospora hydei TaxID=1337664 RepID=A0ABR1XDL7_9PEZI